MKRGRLAARVTIIVVLIALVGVIGALVSARGASASPLIATRAVGLDPSSVAVDARAGRVFVVNNGDDTISMLDARDGRALRTISLSGRPTALAVDERRGHLLIGVGSLIPSGHDTVATLDSHTSALLHSTDVGMGLDAIALDQRAGRAYVANYQGDSLSTLDLASGRTLRTVPVGFDQTTGYAPDEVVVDARAGRVFVMNSSNNSVSMFDAITGRLLRVLPLGQTTSYGTGETGARLMAVDEAGGRLFVAPNAAFGNSIRILDTRTGTTLRTVRLSWSPDDVLLDARTGRVFVSGWAGPVPLFGVLLLDARTGAVVRTFTLGASPLYGGATGVDERTGRIYVLTTPARDSTGAAVGTGHVLALDGATGRVLGTVPVGLLPQGLAVDGLTDRVFVSNINDAEFKRYGYRARAGGGSNPWSWVPQPIRGWLPHAAPPRSAPTGPLH
ncbi:MAG: YncE family protein, partial [Chloroflexi bacterium]|nr:YncE family protein [Chloroflexota bacterium]